MLRPQPRSPRATPAAARAAVRENLRQQLPPVIEKKLPKPKRSAQLGENRVAEAKPVRRHNPKLPKKTAKERQEVREARIEQPVSPPASEKVEISLNQVKVEITPPPLNTTHLTRILSTAQAGRDWLSTQEKAAVEVVDQQRLKHPILIGLLLAVIAYLLNKALEKSLSSEKGINEVEKQNQVLLAKNHELEVRLEDSKKDMREMMTTSQKQMQSASTLLAEHAGEIAGLKSNVQEKDREIQKLRDLLGSKKLTFLGYKVYSQTEKAEEEAKKESSGPSPQK